MEGEMPSKYEVGTVLLGVQVTQGEDHMQTAIGSQIDLQPAQFGLMWVDALRHAAKALKIDEAEIWKWVDRERDHPTTGNANCEPPHPQKELSEDEKGERNEQLRSTQSRPDADNTRRDTCRCRCTQDR